VLATIRRRLQGAESQKVRDQAEVEGAVHQLAPLDVRAHYSALFLAAPGSGQDFLDGFRLTQLEASKLDRRHAELRRHSLRAGGHHQRHVAAAGGIERHSRGRLVWVGGHAGDPGAVEVVGEQHDLAAPAHPAPQLVRVGRRSDVRVDVLLEALLGHGGEIDLLGVAKREDDWNDVLRREVPR